MIWAQFRPHKEAAGEKPTQSRKTWLLAHRVFGCLLMVYCVLQCVGGIGLCVGNFINLMQEGWGTFLHALLGAFLVFVLGFIAVGVTKGKPTPSDDAQIELNS